MKLIGHPCSATLVLTLLLVSLAHAAAEKTIYTFGAPGSGDGMQSHSNPILDTKGDLFGTTLSGGTDNAGIIFELIPGENNQWTETILYEFTGRADGGYPIAGLVFDGKGNLYGTGSAGGANGTGVVFELSPQGDGWNYSVLYSFGAYPASGDGFGPNSPVVFDKLGNLYGITNEGGPAGCFNGCGTVFELSPTGNGGWTEKLIHLFSADGIDGELPSGGVTFEKNGSLYGTAPNGGTANSGVLYQLKYSSTTKSWTESIIHQFVGGSNDGSFPTNVILSADNEGNLYGATDGGGEAGLGTVFKTTYSNKSGWITTILYSLAIQSGDGYSPHAGVTLDAEGNLYGTTSNGGKYDNYGAVFKLSKGQGDNWRESVLHSFTGETDGAWPQAGVTLYKGLLFGTNIIGGNTAGVVYEVGE